MKQIGAVLEDEAVDVFGLPVRVAVMGSGFVFGTLGGQGLAADAEAEDAESEDDAVEEEGQ